MVDVVGLDLSLTSTGVALCNGAFATITTPKVTGMARLGYIRDRVLDLVDECDIVVVEGYSMGSRQGAHQLGELGGVVRCSLWDEGITYVDIAPTRLKKYATGKGNADKDTMLIKAARRWPAVSNNDEADAAWLRDMGMAHYGDGPITEARALVLCQVDWPELPAATA